MKQCCTMPAQRIPRHPYSLQATAHSTTAYVDAACDEVLSALCHGSRCEEPLSPCLEPPALDFGDNGWERIWLLKLNRCPYAVLEALMRGDDLREVRLHLEAYHMQLVIYTGCKVFVWPSQYAQAINALWNYLDYAKIKIQSSHMIVSDSVLPNLEACLRPIPSKHRGNVKSKIELTRCPTTSPLWAFHNTFSEIPAKAKTSTLPGIHSDTPFAAILSRCMCAFLDARSLCRFLVLDSASRAGTLELACGLLHVYKFRVQRKVVDSEF